MQMSFINLHQHVYAEPYERLAPTNRWLDMQIYWDLQHICMHPGPPFGDAMPKRYVILKLFLDQNPYYDLM